MQKTSVNWLYEINKWKYIFIDKSRAQPIPTILIQKKEHISLYALATYLMFPWCCYIVNKIMKINQE